MNIPHRVLVGIALAVERHGGDMTDVDDLIAAWVRIHGDGQPPAAAEQPVVTIPRPEMPATTGRPCPNRRVSRTHTRDRGDR